MYLFMVIDNKILNYAFSITIYFKIELIFRQECRVFC